MVIQCVLFTLLLGVIASARPDARDPLQDMDVMSFLQSKAANRDLDMKKPKPTAGTYCNDYAVLSLQKYQHFLTSII